MAENVDNLVLEQLRAIRGDIARVADDLRGLRTEMMSIRHHVRGLELGQDVDHGDISAIKSRLDRIERRLELADWFAHGIHGRDAKTDRHFSGRQCGLSEPTETKSEGKTEAFGGKRRQLR